MFYATEGNADEYIDIDKIPLRVAQGAEGTANLRFVRTPAMMLVLKLGNLLRYAN